MRKEVVQLPVYYEAQIVFNGKRAAVDVPVFEMMNFEINSSDTEPALTFNDIDKDGNITHSFDIVSAENNLFGPLNISEHKSLKKHFYHTDDINVFDFKAYKNASFEDFIKILKNKQLYKIKNEINNSLHREDYAKKKYNTYENAANYNDIIKDIKEFSSHNRNYKYAFVEKDIKNCLLSNGIVYRKTEAPFIGSSPRGRSICFVSSYENFKEEADFDFERYGYINQTVRPDEHPSQVNFKDFHLYDFSKTHFPLYDKSVVVHNPRHFDVDFHKIKFASLFIQAFISLDGKAEFYSLEKFAKFANVRDNFYKFLGINEQQVRYIESNQSFWKAFKLNKLGELDDNITKIFHDCVYNMSEYRVRPLTDHYFLKDVSLWEQENEALIAASEMDFSFKP